MNLTYDMLYKVSHKSCNMDEEFNSVFAYIRNFTNDKELKYWCEKMYNLLNAVYEHTNDLYNHSAWIGPLLLGSEFFLENIDS